MLNFRKLRLEKKLNQDDFAALIKVSPRALSNYENGNNDITVKKLLEISKVLQVGFFELFELPVTNYQTNDKVYSVHEESFGFSELKKEIEDLKIFKEFMLLYFKIELSKAAMQDEIKKVKAKQKG